MMRVSLLMLMCLVFSFAGKTQDSLQARFLLIGDAGQLYHGRHPVVSSAKKNIPLDEKTTVIYLGDNLYKVGLPDEQLPTYQASKNVLDTLISLGDGKAANIYFIPGNHDWAQGSPNGLLSVQRQQYYIDVLGNKNIKYQPQDGCPGPVEINVSKDVVLVIVDSQWWLHEYNKPGIESDCPYKTKSEVLAQLDDILARNFRKLVVIAMHHPFRSYGSHGSYYTWKQHIFPLTEMKSNLYIPLPLIGSAYPITRGIFGNVQDLRHPVYQNMVRDFEKIIHGHPNVIMANGHEHSLQLLKDSSLHYVVSGSASKAYRVSNNKRVTVWSAAKYGYATLEIFKNKTVRVNMYTVDPETDVTEKAFSKDIMDFSKLPPQIIDTPRKVDFVYKDKVIISASDKYKNPNGFRKTVLGQNYRTAWSTPVGLKVLNIRTEKGGLTPGSLGGGKQTKSLRLKDKNGIEYTLRTLDKDPEKAIPEFLRGTYAQEIVQDMISTGHPYAPLVVADLSKSAGIVAADPQIFFVPDDPAIGFYRSIFANTVCLLEIREPEIDNVSDTRSTGKVINKLIDDPDHRVDQLSYLRARLLDMTVGDWDRHADQWRWATLDTGKGKLYRAIPRDRDQAMFYSDGLLMKYISLNQLPFLEGFNKKFKNIKWLNWEARDLDRFFLNRLDDKAWTSVISEFTTDLSDSAINRAVGKLPPEIYPVDAAKWITKLKSRRNQLKSKGMEYYRFISKVVTIIGTNEKEYFKLNSNGDSLRLRVFDRKKMSDTAVLMYERNFDPEVTKEIRVYGLNGNDLFEIGDDVETRIKVRMIGGRGNDTFNIGGKSRNILYDLSNENNYVSHRSHSTVKFSGDIAVNEYNPVNFSYDALKFPRLNIGFNAEDKTLVGIGFSRKNYRFRKEPFASEQRLTTLFAPSKGAYQVKYQGTYNHAISHSDLLVNLELVNPVLNNFFGIGNTTELDKTKPAEYYRVLYSYTQAELLLRRRKSETLSFTAGPVFYHYWSHHEDNKTRILANPANLGLDSSSIYSTKTYVGGKAGMYIYYLNNDFLPTRGITWNSEFQALAAANSNSKAITRFTTDMTIYGAVTDPAKVIGVFRAGFGHIFSNTYEYFQALTLGANNFNRGFRKNRFSGSTLFYTSLEGRFKLFQSNSYFLPGDIGIIAYNDLGRVWTKESNDKRWHYSYGGGVYFTPFNLVIVAATIGVSNEDQLFNFSLGTKFNLTF